MADVYPRRLCTLVPELPESTIRLAVRLIFFPLSESEDLVPGWPMRSSSQEVDPE